MKLDAKIIKINVIEVLWKYIGNVVESSHVSKKNLVLRDHSI
jgi:hypothetical protein